MIAEVSLLQKSGSLAQEKRRLEHQEKLLKLRTEIANTEAKEKVYEGVNIVKEEEPLHVMLPANRLKIFTFFFHVRPPEVIKKQILGLFTLMLEHGIQRIVSLISETQLSVELKGTSTSVELLEPIIKS